MKKKTKRKLFNHFIELLIVIIGISIAFWLNNVEIKNKEEQSKIAYLTDIRTDLKTDSLRLQSNILINKAKSKKLLKSLELIKKRALIDSVLMGVSEIGNYDFFNPDSFTLASLLQSGDLKLIDSEQTKRELLKLLKAYESIENMQENFLKALDDNYFPMLLTKLDMIEFKPIDEEFFYGIEVKNYCGYTLEETRRHILNYKFAQNQVNKVIDLIDKELIK